jgi:integrase
LTTIKELTNAAVAALAPKADRYEVRDSLCPGLRVVVQPHSGKRSFVFRYSFGGEYRKMTLGSYPLMKLVEPVDEKRDRLARDPESAAPDARSGYRAAKQLLQTGVDPAADKKAKAEAKAAAATDEPDKVGAKWQEFLDKPTKKHNTAKRAGTRKRYERIGAAMLAAWGDRPVTSITKDDCRALIAQAAKRGPEAGRSLHMILWGFFSWLEDRDDVDKSPMRGIAKPAASEGNKGRALRDDELRTIWRATPDFKGFGVYVRLLFLTGQRRMEVATLRWADIDWNERVWALPSKKSKNHKAHLIPLSSAALAELNRLRADAGGNEFVFSARRVDGSETFNNGFSKRKVRFDRATPGVDPWTFHDARRTARTFFAKSGVPKVVASKILNHSDRHAKGDELDATYDLYAYLNERRDALEKLAAHIGELANDHGPNVVPIRA